MNEETVEFLIINLPKDDDRLARIGSSLAAHSLEYRVISAWPGAEAVRSLSRLEIKRVSSGLSPGEVGCALSHIKAYKSTCRDVIFVLEDDVSPRERLPDFAAIAGLVKPGDLFLLGASTKHEYLAGRPHDHHGVSFFELDLFSRYMLRGACAYALHKETAAQIEGAQRERLMPADSWWWFLRRGVIKRVLITDAFVHPRATPTQSNLEGERQSGSKQRRFRATLRRALKPPAVAVFSITRRIAGAVTVYPHA